MTKRAAARTLGRGQRAGEQQTTRASAGLYGTQGNEALPQQNEA